MLQPSFFFEMLAGHENTLSALFKKASACAKSLEVSGQESEIQEAIMQLNECSEMIRQLALFSKNECLDDLSTANIRFMTCDYLIAELKLMIHPKGSDRNFVRKNILQDARNDLKSFVNLCECYGLINIKHRQLLNFTSNAPSREELRKWKIESYKRSKELESIISQRIKDDSDDDESREWYLKIIELSVYKAVDHLRSISEELEMISISIERQKFEKTKRLSDADKDIRVDSKLNLTDTSTALLDDKGKVQRPFVITSKREQFKDQVFRPGHNLPTMTIEEYLEKEISRGNFLSQKDNASKKEITSDDEEELYKQRQMDDFKDDNPRGWGNRMNKG